MIIDCYLWRLTTLQNRVFETESPKQSPQSSSFGASNLSFMMAIQKDGRTDSEVKRWQFDGVSPRTPLKPLSTNSAKRDLGETAEGEEEDECSTTPVAEESRIPTRLPCPPAPRKRRPVQVQQFQINVFKDFFVPPTADLNSVFKPRFDS